MAYSDRLVSAVRFPDLPRGPGGARDVLLSLPRVAAGEDSYGKTSTRPAAQHDDRRMSMGDPPRRAAGEIIDDDIPF